MTDRVVRTTWHGVEALDLEGPAYRVTMVPQMGAKIVSLADRRDGFEWLIGPGDRPVKPVLYGAEWERQEMAGWDEMFPTIDACTYPGEGPLHGTAVPDHGEAWTLPWSVESSADDEIVLSLLGRVLPYRLTRAARFSALDVLQLDYTLVNLGEHPMPYIWAAHPQFLTGDSGVVVLPPEVTEVVNTIPASWGWGDPETRLQWPGGVDCTGNPLPIDRVGPPTLRRGRKVFAPPSVRPSWATVVRQADGRWLRFEWDAARVPYLGLWVDEGSINHASVAVPEPTTGWYDSLEIAWHKGEVTILPAGAATGWSLDVRLGTNGLG